MIYIQKEPPLCGNILTEIVSLMEIYEVSNAFDIIVRKRRHLSGMRAFDLADRADIS